MSIGEGKSPGETYLKCAAERRDFQEMWRDAGTRFAKRDWGVQSAVEKKKYCFSDRAGARRVCREKNGVKALVVMPVKWAVINDPVCSSVAKID